MVVRSAVYAGDNTDRANLESRMQYTYTQGGLVGGLSYQEKGNDMYFDYEQYYVECLINPIAVMIFSLIPFVYGCVLIVKRPHTRTDIKVWIGLLVFGFMLYLQVGCLINGGIHLFQEKETDAVKTTGYISYIGALSEFEMPRMSTEYESNGLKRVEISINDIHCKAPVKGDLKVGDYVEVEYLPKSGYVLYIDRAEVE